MEKIFDILALPLSFLADFLGNLSLSGKVGNVVAIVLYSVLCLAPVFVLILKKVKRTFEKTDALLILLSVTLFAVVYFMINPYEMGMIGEIEGAGNIVSICFWAVFIGYLILKFLSSVEKNSFEDMEKPLKGVLIAVGIVFVISLSFLAVGELPSALKESEGFVPKFMSFMTFLSRAIPDFFGILIVFSTLKLLNQMRINRYGEETVLCSEKLSSLCIFGVKASVFVSIIYNILELRYIAELQSVNFSADIPLLSLGFILAVLILSRYIKDSKSLKEDNDSFI